MHISGLQKLTLIDYPNKLACTVFLAGCNFRCPWCYSRELVLPQEIKKQPKISERGFFKFLQERRGFLEGVCLCGGEPTIQRGLSGFVKKIKRLGYPVKLDTNGSNPKMLKRLIGSNLVDYVAMDVKAPLRVQSAKCKVQSYNQATGVEVDLAKIRQSIGIIKNSGVDYEFRTTVVPSLHARGDIMEIARGIASAKRYFLQGFLPEKTLDPQFAGLALMPAEDLLDIQKAVAPFFDDCQVRNLR